MDWLKSLAEDCAFYSQSLAQLMTIIINFDEAGIQYKSIPQRSYVGRDCEIRAKKPTRCRITGLFGASATGHKFKPLIIGKAANPRAFRGIDRNTMPVHYKHSRNAWMTGDLFREWYLEDFLHEIDELRAGPIRIQFLIDNCSAHPISLDDLDPDVFVKFYHQILLQ